MVELGLCVLKHTDRELYKNSTKIHEKSLDVPHAFVQGIPANPPIQYIAFVKLEVPLPRTELPNGMQSFEIKMFLTQEEVIMHLRTKAKARGKI